MPSYILKPKPDEAFYVQWSTVVDSPTAWGTRQALSAALSEWDARRAAPERFDRADLTGTSAHGGYYYGWNCDTALIRELDGVPDGLIRLSDLRQVCEAIEREDVAALRDLVEPLRTSPKTRRSHEA